MTFSVGAGETGDRAAAGVDTSCASVDAGITGGGGGGGGAVVGAGGGDEVEGTAGVRGIAGIVGVEGVEVLVVWELVIVV